MRWNSLITDSAKRGEFSHALSLFHRIRGLDHILLRGPAFVALLKLCIARRDADSGSRIHAEASRRGLLRSDHHVGSALVDMYAKCGRLPAARQVFDALPLRNVVSWTALITGHVEAGDGEAAISCFEEMRLEAVAADAVTLVCGLKACGMAVARDKGQCMHSEAVTTGFESNVPIGCTLVDMYAKCGLLSDAEDVFYKLPARNVVSWTALIAGYTDRGHGHEALRRFDLMQRKGVHPDSVTFVCALKACSLLENVDRAIGIHMLVSRQGLERNLIVGSALVDMYAKCGFPRKARQVFDKLPVRDVVVWTSLIAGYAESGESGEDALECLEEMSELDSISPGSATYVCGLKACGTVGNAIKTLEIHASIAKKGFEQELLVGNALLDAYAKCGSLTEAHRVLDELPMRDVISWTALIMGYSQLGETANVFDALQSMVEENVEPNLATFVNVLNACNHAGLVGMGERLLEAMLESYALMPTVEHYTCVIDLLGRAGSVDRVLSMVEQMPFHPGIVVWHAILGACRKWGNVDLARHAFEHAVRFDDKDASSYIAMFNIYADASMHQEAHQIEAMRVEKQAFRLEKLDKRSLCII